MLRKTSVCETAQRNRVYAQQNEQEGTVLTRRNEAQL